jgi:16S rRNA (uracil1498-N3)-methyltransferase
MRRYWIPKESLVEDTVSFSGDVFHHVFHVCRVQEGQKIEVLCGDDKAYLVQISSISKKSAQANVVEVRDVNPLPKPYIDLCVSIPRWATLDTIVEKAVELGAAKLTPFVSDYSFVRELKKVPENKKARWPKIVQGATQQSGRGQLMPVEEPALLESIISEINQNEQIVGLFPYEGSGGVSVKKALTAIDWNGVEEVKIIVGSEGGFSAREVERFQAVGMHPITLGEQVLRVETACLAMVSILKYELGLFS